MWERYCRGVQAIVYVVDAADHDSLDQARAELQDLLAKPALNGIPLLVLGNKNDLPGALTTGELIDRLDLKVCGSPIWTEPTLCDFQWPSASSFWQLQMYSPMPLSVVGKFISTAQIM